MSTRSVIAFEQTDGKVTAVYCHWDGYPEGVGRTLLESFVNVEEIARLVSLGSLSSLGARIDPDPDQPHSFNAPQPGVCVFYGRDRGTEGVEPQELASRRQVVGSWFGIDYYYLYSATESRWQYRGRTGEWKSLASAVKISEAA